MISLNDSIDFVQRFHWFRSTISMEWLRQTAVLCASLQRFQRIKLTVSTAATAKPTPRLPQLLNAQKAQTTETSIKDS
ncbi:MAG: hypothetical protein IKH22_04655 [Prevotella sp.]|nr:hypothetical protein [Prevotella sp.]